MEVPICRHIKTNGLQCHAPSLNEAPYCYFHTRLHQRHAGFRSASSTRTSYFIPGRDIELTALEDRESVQIALSVVINALATGNLEPKRATALLYGLQLASINSAKLHLEPYAPNIVRTIDSSPEGLDLAEPGAMVDITPLELSDYKDPDDDDDDDEDEDEDEDEDKD
jgi:hypothetical protein